jgi:hypothetical protein
MGNTSSTSKNYYMVSDFEQLRETSTVKLNDAKAKYFTKKMAAQGDHFNIN